MTDREIHFAMKLLLLPVLATFSQAGEFVLTGQRPRIQSPAIKEASGIAISQQSDDFLWIVNDSGSAPEIHLVNTDGADRGWIKLARTANTDWEDLASFTLGGNTWLLVADTGDNDAKRKSCTLHILPEPRLPADGGKLAGEVAVTWRIEFTYEGGPRDCESVAVDSARERVLLVSKRTNPPEVYELPLRKSPKRGVAVARKIGQTRTERAAGLPIPFANQPVGMDISADNSLSAIVTYGAVFLFPRQPDESWVEAFSHKPVELAPHGIGQAESVAFSKDAKSIYVVSEGKNAPIRCYRR